MVTNHSFSPTHCQNSLAFLCFYTTPSSLEDIASFLSSFHKITLKKWGFFASGQPRFLFFTEWKGAWICSAASCARWSWFYGSRAYSCAVRAPCSDRSCVPSCLWIVPTSRQTRPSWPSRTERVPRVCWPSWGTCRCHRTDYWGVSGWICRGLVGPALEVEVNKEKNKWNELINTTTKNIRE